MEIMTDKELYLEDLKNPNIFNPENLEHLRNIREYLCFRIVNRGGVWYDTLTAQEKTELMTWYIEWLGVTETQVIPKEPAWLK
jgi:hypothetical protein